MEFCCIRIILLMLCGVFSVMSLHRQKSWISCSRQSIIHAFAMSERPSGYIPPELDPEYRKNTVFSKALGTSNRASNVSSSEMASLPLPKEGDIVLFKGKFGDEQIGRIRYLQYVAQYESFFADIIPLKEGKSEDVFVLDKNSKAEYVRVSEIRPVRFYFVRAENGYKLYKEKKNPQKVVLKAAGYGEIDKDYNFRSKAIDFSKLTTSMEEYALLKSRIITSSLKLGAAIAALITALFGLSTAIDYSIGVGAGALYLFLLGKRVDTIGSKYSALQANSTITAAESAQKNFYDNASKGRLLVPVLLVALLTARNVLVDGNTPQYLQLLPQQQFVSAMSGFLTVRFSIFFSEVTKEIRTEDWIGLVPGSLAVVIRNQWLKDKDEAKAEAEAAAIARVASAVYKVIYVTGPAAAGRHDLLSRLMVSSGVKDTKKFSACKLLTTNKLLSEATSEWYEYVTTEQIMELRNSNELIYEGTDRNDLGEKINVALSRSSLRALYTTLDESMPFVLMTGPPELLDVLSSVDDISPTNIWVSLQTKEQFISSATEMLQKKAKLSKAEGVESLQSIAKDSAEKVTELVNEAARDINFYMQKAPLFDFTILNSSPGSEGTMALEELKGVVLNMRDT